MAEIETLSRAEELKNLIGKANYYRDLYYNRNISEITDKEYDDLFDKIAKLENETGIVYTNSPTQNVGYEVVSDLKKVNHNHLMLSLGKTKDLNEIQKFLGDKKGVVMGKMDGLTMSLRYLDGKLVSAETRGDGQVGEDVLHNAKVVENIPLQIAEKSEVIIDGELIIPLDVFSEINSQLPEGEKYKHARNLASGSIRQLDSNVAKNRHMHFIAWKLIKVGDPKIVESFENSFIKQWFYMDELGFETVPLIELVPNLPIERLNQAVTIIKEACKTYNLKIDGCVFGYDDLDFSETLGATEHHLRSQIALKFYDEQYPTTLNSVEWQVGRTGVLSPVAIFDPVDIDGSTITRATLHNPSYIGLLGLQIGCTVNIIKANDVIPRVESCEKDGFMPITLPELCPVCGSRVEYSVSDSGVTNLICTNLECPAKQLAKFTHFVSRDCANIDGLSEATLERFINLGYLKSYADIYHLDRYAHLIKNLEGFGEKSWGNLWNAIEQSRNITLSKYINALGIPLIGKKAAKSLSKYYKGNFEEFNFAFNEHVDWTNIEDFGQTMSDSINNFNDKIVQGLANEFTFLSEYQETTGENVLEGKTLCVTGALVRFTRETIAEKIESLGGKMSSSVTSKTDFLVTNTPDSGSSKNKKARELGTRIITEQEFLMMIGE